MKPIWKSLSGSICVNLCSSVDEGFVKVAEISQIPPGSVKGVVVDATYIAIYNVKGELFATRDCCTHQAYPLSKGILRGKYVTCSLHGWEFDVRTGEYQGNPSIKVKTFELKVDGEDVYVRP